MRNDVHIVPEEPKGRPGEVAVSRERLKVADPDVVAEARKADMPDGEEYEVPAVGTLYTSALYWVIPGMIALVAIVALLAWAVR